LTADSADQTPINSLFLSAVDGLRANLRRPRAYPLLVNYYLKQGLTAEELRLAAEQAAARAHSLARTSSVSSQTTRLAA
jgi:hypothetical protein